MPGVDDLLTGTALAERATLALAVPLVAALEVRLLDASDPTAGVRFEVAGGIADNGAGGVHASVLGAVLELASYLALLPQLRRDEHAVSHAVATQLLAAPRRGERVEARGAAEPRTGRLGFVTAVADGPAGGSPGPR
jgi:acyl-coenzyme A thioesterase PaaI-like protein